MWKLSKTILGKNMITITGWIYWLGYHISYAKTAAIGWEKKQYILEKLQIGYTYAMAFNQYCQICWFCASNCLNCNSSQIWEWITFYKNWYLVFSGSGQLCLQNVLKLSRISHSCLVQSFKHIENIQFGNLMSFEVMFFFRQIISSTEMLFTYFTTNSEMSYFLSQ